MNPLLSSIRFGKAHIFSNFFENNSSAINIHVGACVKVEHNYFINSGTAIKQTGEAALDMDPATNIFIKSTVQSGIPACNLSVPYPYEDLIDPASALPDLIPSIVRVTSSAPAGLNANAGSIFNIQHYPNPVRDQLTIEFLMTHSVRVKLEVYNIMGVKVMQLLNDGMPGSGWHRMTFPMNQLDHGLIMLDLRIGDQVVRRKFIKE